MVARRVVVCHVKLSRVNSRRIKIRVDLRRNSRRFASQHRVIKSTIIRVYLRHNVEIRVGLRRNNFVMVASQVVVSN